MTSPTWVIAANGQPWWVATRPRLAASLLAAGGRDASDDLLIVDEAGRVYRDDRPEDQREPLDGPVAGAEAAPVPEPGPEGE